MVKKEYYRNEFLGLAWDCMEASQVDPFYTAVVADYGNWWYIFPEVVHILSTVTHFFTFHVIQKTLC